MDGTHGPGKNCWRAALLQLPSYSCGPAAPCPATSCCACLVVFGVVFVLSCCGAMHKHKLLSAWPSVEVELPDPFGLWCVLRTFPLQPQQKAGLKGCRGWKATGKAAIPGNHVAASRFWKQSALPAMMQAQISACFRGLCEGCSYCRRQIKSESFVWKSRALPQGEPLSTEE